MAIRKCREKGYSRIGLIASDALNEKWGGMMTIGWNDDSVSRRNSLRIPPLMLHPVARYRVEELGTWLEKYKPDVVIGPNNRQSEISQGLGYDIPGDFAYCGLSYIQKYPQTAGIERRFALAGRLLVEQVVEQIHHNVRGVVDAPVSVSFEGEWKDGESLPDRSG